MSRCLFAVVVGCLVACTLQRSEAAAEWKYRKGTHFIIQYEQDISDNLASDTLREAERFYDTLARQIGYTRYRKFWTWDQRVKIVLYADQESYVRETGLPAWSGGGATQYHRQLKSRAIVSYRQERNFLNKILPHEISHLILADFFGRTPVPLWFNEGVAQLQESGKVAEARRLIAKVAGIGYVIPLESLVRMDVRIQTNQGVVLIFYAQSVSIVDFLIRQHGNRRFQNLCRFMREGLPFQRALGKAYTGIFDSPAQLEEKWLYSVKN